MNNLKIGTRLNIAFGAMLALLVIIAYIGWSSLSATKARMDTVVNENNAKIALSNRMLLDLNLIARSARNYILYTDKDVQAKMVARMDAPKRVLTPASNNWERWSAASRPGNCTPTSRRRRPRR